MARQNKNRLVSIDAVEERPRWGASKKDSELHAQLRVKNRRIAELEEALGAKARGNDGGIAITIRVTAHQHEHLGYLTRGGHYGQTVEATVEELLHIALREPMALENAHAQRFKEEYPRGPRRPRRRRPRRRPGKR